MLWQLLAALASGLLVTLTPCVYPLIPVTVSYFDQQGGGSRAKAVPLALAYGAGIIAMYAILGVVMARLGRDLGSLLGNAYVAWGFAAFFVLLALSMFGLYEITLPSSVATRLQSGERSGVAGAFLLGVTLGLVAAPCTGPVTGGLMLVVAQTGDVLFGLLAFGSFGLGLALPFSTLGVFSGALRAMPRAGAWMESVKHVFGYVLTAFAIYFAYVATGSNALTFALAGAWLLAAGAAAASTASVPARALGAALLAAGLYFLCGPYVIAPEGPIKSPERLFESRVEWDHDHDAALAAAKAQGKPVIVDFSARWCNACHELDLTTFRDDAVVREMARFVAVKVDVTSDEKNQRLKTETYKAFQIPFIAFYDSAGRKVASLPKEGASGITTEDVLHLLRETR
jgi:thiol:disulfide interchange protein DsbD